ncbi:MAG TPA: hypothetical protein VJ258_04970 [Candidatus Limnocylindrales bacterium]|nr:hypothetical protein [Candidatus Limnocylindrales bacterium]
MPQIALSLDREYRQARRSGAVLSVQAVPGDVLVGPFRMTPRHRDVLGDLALAKRLLDEEDATSLPASTQP